jgi:hypothetical protein
MSREPIITNPVRFSFFSGLWLLGLIWVFAE